MADFRGIETMDKADFIPSIHSYEHIKPFRFWCQKVLPLVYDDSLSYYELLCKVVDYLNRVIKETMEIGEDVTNLRNAFEELQKYVNDYFSSLDVQEEINNKLDEMVKDGTLEGLIQNVLIKTPVSNYADMEYLCSDIRYYAQSGGGEYEKVPTEPEGIAYISDSSVVVFYACGGGYGGYCMEDDLVLCREYKFTDDRTSSFIVREKLLLGLQHANTCGYNPKTNEIYVANAGYSNAEKTGTIGSKKVTIVDYATLTVKETFEINTDELGGYTFGLICFDKVQEKFYVCVRDMVGVVDLETKKATYLFSWSKEFAYASHLQGLSVIDNYCYIGNYNPNTIYCYEINTGTLVKVINIPESDVDGHILRYPQDFDYDPKTFDFYINIWCGIGQDAYRGNPNLRACYVFKFNPFKNVTTAGRQTQSGLLSVDNVIYVSKNNNVYQKGTSAWPFSTIGEAINAIRFATNDYFINVEAGVYDEYLDIQKVNCSFVNGAFTVNSLTVHDCVCRFEQKVTCTGKYTKNDVVRVFNSLLNVNQLIVEDAPVGYSALLLSYSVMNCSASLNAYINKDGVNMFNISNSIYNGYFASGNTGNELSCIVNQSQLLRSIIPGGNQTKNIQIIGSSKCTIEVETSKYTVANFYGLMSVGVNVKFKTQENVIYSSPRRIFSNAGTTFYIPMWFGFIRVRFDTGLQLIEPIDTIKYTDDDISGLEMTLRYVTFG